MRAYDLESDDHYDGQDDAEFAEELAAHYPPPVDGPAPELLFAVIQRDLGGAW